MSNGFKDFFHSISVRHVQYELAVYIDVMIESYYKIFTNINDFDFVDRMVVSMKNISL